MIAYTTCVREMALKFQLMRNLVQFANWAGWLSQTNHDEDFLDQEQAETRAFSDEFIRNFRESFCFRGHFNGWLIGSGSGRKR